MKTLWAVGGHDPNAVAGIQADLLTAHSLGVIARTLIGSFTAQSDQTVALSAPVPTAWFKAQWETLRAQERPVAIKLGLLNHPDLLLQLRDLLVDMDDVPVVADPVLAASAGPEFSREDMATAFRELLFPRLSLLTPNIPEAEALLGYRLEDADAVIKGAAELRSWGLAAVLIKGGHRDGDPADYFDDGQRPFWLSGKRVTQNFRGTGCTLATAITAFLVKGLPLREAVVMAHSYLQDRLQASAAQGAPYIEYHSRDFRLSPLSLALPREKAPFAAMDRVGFYPIVPDVAWLKRLVDAGVPSIQLRMKDVPEAEVLASIQEAVAYCAPRSVQLFINDYWQLALACKAYGVHLGQEDLDLLSPLDLEALQKAGVRLGISTHSYEEAARALALRPSYIALGPVFETTCKSMAFGPQGMERVREWVRLCAGTPIVGIGGLKHEHAETLLAYGASGLSVITDVLQNADPEGRTQAWMKSFA